jgi:hypothetical protein
MSSTREDPTDPPPAPAVPPGAPAPSSHPSANAEENSTKVSEHAQDLFMIDLDSLTRTRTEQGAGHAAAGASVLFAAASLRLDWPTVLFAAASLWLDWPTVLFAAASLWLDWPTEPESRV